jgi:hypothetical protein
MAGPRHTSQVDLHAGAGLVGHLNARAGQSGGTQVLHARDDAAIAQLKARFHEQLLGQRIADLDRRPPFV